MFKFLLGIFIGAIIGIGLMCILQVAKEEDE
jgi:gas vesicle protein